jgi:hypothetical protein
MLVVSLAACASVSVTLPDQIGPRFDLDKTLTDLRDCGTLSDTFVAVVREAAQELDDLAASSGGKVPSGTLTAKVDVIAKTSYFKIGEKLGCDAVAQRVDTLDRLRGLSPSSAAGKDLVGQVMDQVEAQSP